MVGKLVTSSSSNVAHELVTPLLMQMSLWPVDKCPASQVENNSLVSPVLIGMAPPGCCAPGGVSKAPTPTRMPLRSGPRALPLQQSWAFVICQTVSPAPAPPPPCALTRYSPSRSVAPCMTAGAIVKETSPALVRLKKSYQPFTLWLTSSLFSRIRTLDS